MPFLSSGCAMHGLRLADLEASEHSPLALKWSHGAHAWPMDFQLLVYEMFGSVISQAAYEINTRPTFLAYKKTIPPAAPLWRHP
jgi:hypothetical protein